MAESLETRRRVKVLEEETKNLAKSGRSRRQGRVMGKIVYLLCEQSLTE